MNPIRFFLYFLLAYFALVYFWARFGNLYIREVESIIFPSLFHSFKNFFTSIKLVDYNRKLIPIPYGEQIHDAIKDYTNNNFDMTLWKNGTYSKYKVPCYSMDIVPKNNNIDNDLSIIEVQAFDRFQKCTLADGFLASRIISEKSLGKVYLHFLYASNEEELRRYNKLLQIEKNYADSVGLRNSVPISDDCLSEALNLFDDTVGDTHAQH